MAAKPLNAEYTSVTCSVVDVAPHLCRITNCVFDLLFSFKLLDQLPTSPSGPLSKMQAPHLASFVNRCTTSLLDRADEDVGGLPVDALTACFQWLDCRSLGRCSCVSQTWSTAASDPDIWRKYLTAIFHRPAMLLQYSQLLQPPVAASSKGASHVSGFKGAPASADILHEQKDVLKLSTEATCMDAAGATGSSVVSTSPKTLIDWALVHPAAQHQALLACFHSAMAQIQGWRLLIERTPPASPQTSAAGAEQLQTHPERHTEDLQQNVSSAPHLQQQPNSDSRPTNSNNTRQSEFMVGHPLPLTWSDLESGKTWAIGYVQQQQQEQSCWVRFNLPPELKLELQLMDAAGDNELTATVQALGPASVGWFDVITCHPFCVEEDDMEILYQSHKTGFYAWDQSAEDGRDLTEEAEPMPWDAPVGGPGHAAGLQGTTGPGSHVATEVQQQHFDLEDLDLEQQCKLRMVVYIHYEQLLKMLPLQLAQSLPLPSALQQQWYRQSKSIQAAARQLLLHSNAALWLHMDVCQLHGGFRLGSCVAPLELAMLGLPGVQFKAHQGQVLAALYDPHCSMNCSSSSSVAAQPIKSSTEQQNGVLGSAAVAAPSDQVLAEAGCRLVVVGDRVVHGKQRVGSEGLLLMSAVEVMRELLSMDEVMVDFSLFDAEGRLLLGRAGVEVWIKEQTSAHAPARRPPLAAQHFVSQLPQVAAEQLPPPPPPESGGPVADNAGESPPSTITHTRTVQKLHFLVDDVESSLWDNGITVDAASAPHGVDVPLLALNLTWPALKGLFGGAKQQKQKPGWMISAEDILKDPDMSEALHDMWDSW